MAYFRGGKLRASTFQITGEYRALNVVCWDFLMILFLGGFLKHIASGKLSEEINKINI